MNSKPSRAKYVDWLLIRDIGISFIATWIILVSYFNYSVGDAFLAASIGVVTFCLAIYLFIQITWFTVNRLDRILLGYKQRRNY